MKTLGALRDPNDARLPALSDGGWWACFLQNNSKGKEVEHKSHKLVDPNSWVYSEVHATKTIVATADYATERDLGNFLVMAASKAMLGHLFGLLVNFPGIREGKDWDPGDNSELVAWLEEQVPYWEETLRAAGVELDREP